MRDQTLPELRREIAGLSSPDGLYEVVCRETGDTPVPAEGYRFPDRETARRAASAVAAYRGRLREYDPRLPVRDPVVAERVLPGPNTRRGETA
jgi:hypothetical protein